MTQRVGILGGGLIGQSWAALFAAHGWDVTVVDPRPEAAQEVAADERLVAEAVEGTPYEPVRVDLSAGEVEVVLVGPLESEELDGETMAADIASAVGKDVTVIIRIIPEKEIVIDVSPTPDG